MRRAKEESVLHKPEKMTLSNVYSSRNKGLHSQTSYNFISARSIRFQSERTQLYVLVQELLAISLWLAAKNILETRQRENSGLDIFVSKKNGMNRARRQPFYFGLTVWRLSVPFGVCLSEVSNRLRNFTGASLPASRPEQ